MVRKATVAQITTCYNQSLQNSISKHTICSTLKQKSTRGAVPVSQEQETNSHKLLYNEKMENIAWSDLNSPNANGLHSR